MSNLPARSIVENPIRHHTVDTILPTPSPSWPVTPTVEHSFFYTRDIQPAPLALMLEHFPEIPSILAHPQFITLVRLWRRLQLNISLSKTPEYRSCISEDLGHIAIQCDAVIQHLLASLCGSHAYPDPPTEQEHENSEADPNLAITAFAKLKERVETLQLVLQVIENGRIWFGQEPKEALSPVLGSHMVALQQQEQQQQQQQQLLHVDSSCLTCAYVHPSAVVVKTEETQDEQCPQDTWGIPSITATPIMTKDLPAMQEQARMDYGDNTHDGEDEVLSGQDTDDSQSVFESPFDDDTEFEPMDEEDTYDDDDDDDDDEYTETKRAVRSSRRHDTQPQKQKSRASKQATRRKDGDNDKSAENSDEGILATRRIFRTPRHHTRRTATSYDAETTHYLKSVFFSIYSKRDKLTKEQRRQVQIHTGLKPRNITYWFSNHKRRFQRALKVYKQTVQKTGGAIKSYDDFLLWRRRHGLTDEVLDDEEEGPDEDMASPIPPTPQMTTDGDTTSSSPWTLP